MTRKIPIPMKSLPGNFNRARAYPMQILQKIDSAVKQQQSTWCSTSN